MAIKINELDIAKSKWQDCKIVAETNGFLIIMGKWVDEGVYRMGATWYNYPKSRGKLSPVVIPNPYAKILLQSMHTEMKIHDKVLAEAKEKLLTDE